MNFGTNQILITGANGWLGKTLVNCLLNGISNSLSLEIPQKNLSIKCLVKPNEDIAILKSLSENISIIEGNLNSKEDCKFFTKDSKNAILFHCAGVIHPKKISDFYEINAHGTKNILEEAQKSRIKRAIILSSNSPFGINPSKNHTFDESIDGTWEHTPASPAPSAVWTNASEQELQQHFARYKYDKIGTQSGDTTFPWNDLQAGKLNFESYPHKAFGGTAAGWAREYGAWQKIDVSNLFFIDLEVNGQSAAQIKDNVDIACDFGELRVGLSSVDPEEIAISQGTLARNSLPKNVRLATGSGAGNFSIHRAENYDLGYLEWNDGTSSWKHLRDVDVSEYDYIWVWVQSFSPWTPYSITEFTTEPGDDPGVPNSSVFGNSGSVNRVGAVKINSAEPDNMLREANADRSSTTRNNYNSSTPSENNNDNYEDDTYWPSNGSRYGIDTTRAQVNGSFYVDNRMGKINFSSNISGKTVILDYISDSLGTDEEMQVHKFAEEAMYKCIAYAILSTRANTQEYIIQRFKKERFAAMRTAKLRMSNIKIEELTQILRGKSKWIKH